MWHFFDNMINEYQTRRFCCEDISLIENYEQAINDKTQTWHCHHRVEILPCGTFSRNDLKKHNLLFNRPANELVFLTCGEHRRLHGMNQSAKTREKISKSMSAALKGNTNRLGHYHTEETRAKMSAAHMGNTNFLGHHHSEEARAKLSAAIHELKWWNNGQINVRARECPQGFVPGRLSKKK